ncbi:hypothetical protein D1AOALGA4SA_6596 [Olavius algarvensis Delta 1 endosymbiont]|nr:hypothetical protein D1AOALGA4SA_6596 [Olavius algarvensis Delta 1 endosymbiont]
MLSGKQPAWFNQFISNLSSQFKSADAEGPVRIVEQRPADALPDWVTTNCGILHTGPWCNSSRKWNL